MNILWQLKENILRLLDEIGERQYCPRCGMLVWRVNGRLYDSDAAWHELRCGDNVNLNNKQKGEMR